MEWDSNDPNLSLRAHAETHEKPCADNGCPLPTLALVRQLLSLPNCQRTVAWMLNPEAPGVDDTRELLPVSSVERAPGHSCRPGTAARVFLVQRLAPGQGADHLCCVSCFPSTTYTLNLIKPTQPVNPIFPFFSEYSLRMVC